MKENKKPRPRITKQVKNFVLVFSTDKNNLLIVKNTLHGVQ